MPNPKLMKTLMHIVPLMAVLGMAACSNTEEKTGSMDDNNKELLTPEMIKQADEARQKIINGEIKVTDAMTK